MSRSRFFSYLTANERNRTAGYLGIDPVFVIAIAQLFGTSLWFSANSAASDLMLSMNITEAGIGWLTSAVQAGFIMGTLLVALTGLADRFSPSRIFLFSAVAGALFNALFAWLADSLTVALALRFLVGLSLAGIYPIGMKLVVGWAPQRTGAALGLLLAMLVLGTALPHALRGGGAHLPWQYIITASSLLAVAGGILVARLGDGPGLGQPSAEPATAHANAKPLGILDAFKIRRFRAAAVGYFGHMWELYAFWTLVPLLVARTLGDGTMGSVGVSAWSFLIIAAGAVGCILGGNASRRVGSPAVALTALACSGACALVFVSSWHLLPPWALAAILLLWGASVSADSPQFSAMSAAACPPQLVGTALAIQNSIGFALTVVSISLTSLYFEAFSVDALWILVPGPVIGLVGYFWLASPVDKKV